MSSLVGSDPVGANNNSRAAVVEPGVRHDVEALEMDSGFLLTVAMRKA